LSADDSPGRNRGAALKTPDILVLGAGGILGEAWTSSLLAGLSENGSFDARGCDALIGTSAGSIVAAMLCGGVEPSSRVEDLPEQPPVAESEQVQETPLARALRSAATLGGAVTGPLASVVLHTTVPGGRLLRREGLRRVRRGRRSLEGLGRQIEESGVEWDGRLRIAVVELETGRRVMLDGSQPGWSVSDAVQASCAIPGVFRPIERNGHSYVDGGAWSVSNLDTAPVEKGTDVLCLNPTASLSSGRSAPMSLLGRVSRSVASVEAASVRRRGATVRVISPDAQAAALMGPNLMREGPHDDVLAAGLAQGRRLAAT
jgi:NTE family protein